MARRGFIHSDKRALIACIEAKGLKLSPEARATLARQDDRIYSWRNADAGAVQAAAMPQEPPGCPESPTRTSTRLSVTNPPQPARVTPDRFGGMVSPAWRVGIG